MIEVSKSGTKALLRRRRGQTWWEFRSAGRANHGTTSADWKPQTVPSDRYLAPPLDSSDLIMDVKVRISSTSMRSSFLYNLGLSSSAFDLRVIMQTLCQIDVVLWYRACRTKCPFNQNNADDRAATGRSDFANTEDGCFAKDRRIHHQIQIDPATDQQDDGDAHHDRSVSLGRLGKQDEKRHQPVQYNRYHHHWAPWPVCPRDEIGSLFWNIRIPNQHVLAEPYVHPKAAKSDQ